MGEGRRLLAYPSLYTEGVNEAVSTALPRWAQPKLCLFLAWLGMAALWGGHHAAQSRIAHDDGVTRVAGVIRGMRVSRTGGIMLSVVDHDNKTWSVAISPVAGRLEGLALGRVIEEAPCIPSEWAPHQWVPVSLAAVRLGGVEPLDTVARVRALPPRSRVCLRVRARDVKRNVRNDRVTSVRCEMYDASGAISAKIDVPEARVLALLEQGEEVAVSGVTATYRGGPDVAVSSVIDE